MKRRFLLYTISVFLTGFLMVYGSGFYPVRNFNRRDYGGGTQNWSVGQDKSGRVYFGNHDGLLRYDGIRWQLFPLPNYTTVRSINVDSVNFRIYAGGSDEFGYYQIDSVSGRMIYKSLVPDRGDTKEKFGEIWDIHNMGDGRMAFRGDYAVFIDKGGKIEKIRLPAKSTASLQKGEIIYIGFQDGRIMTLSGGKLREVEALGGLRDAKIVSLLDDGEGGIVVVTALNGLYMLRDGTLTPLTVDINPYLMTNQAFTAARQGDLYAFGTVDGGAVVKNFRTGETKYVTGTTGLQNNTVLGLGFDFTGNLWMCLDNGIDYALVDSPILYLLGSGSDAGAGYASMIGGSHLFLGTNRGLYSTPYPVVSSSVQPPLHKLLSGQVWDIDTIGNDMFISADAGLFHLNLNAPGTGPSRIEGIPLGTWHAAPIGGDPSRILVSSYRHFYLVRKSGGRWGAEGAVEGFDDAGGQFVEDSDGYIWLAHWIRGVYRFRLDADNLRFTDVRLFNEKDGLPNARDNSVALVDGEAVVATASGKFYKYSDSGKMVCDTLLSDRIPLHTPFHFYPSTNGVSLAVSPSVFWKITDNGDKNPDIDSVSFRAVSGSLIPGFENVQYYDEKTLLVSQQEGFYLLDLAGAAGNNPTNATFVESVISGDSLLYTHSDRTPSHELRIPYSLNSVTLNMASPEYRRENAVLFSFYLENYDKDWTSPSPNASKEYTRLSEGDYVFRYRAENTITGRVTEGSFKFTVLAPWYRSTVAKIIYCLLIIGFIYFSFRMLKYLSLKNAKKIEKKKEEELTRLRREAEQEALQKDYEIAALKGEQLEQDIKHKSSELSNITMNVIRKNEILQSVSSKITRLQEAHGGNDKADCQLYRELESIQESIQENISHDDDWKRFNQNFDIVYENFTKRLTELHPGLTIQERRLCCYLKMGLSSKEIAPLFNISAKSVEMNRYRLRRKMGLDRSVNLTAYLQEL